MYQIVNYFHENSQAITDFKLMSRYLWDDHISYTRNTIISSLASLSDLDAVFQRLLKNQKDLGMFISPYFSTDEVSTFVTLLTTHITIAGDVIQGVPGAEEKWRSNGHDIVNYMSTLNPMFWPVSKTSPLWTKHLDLTIAQIDSRKNSQWTNDVNAYDDNHKCMSEFADLFSNGIIYQNIGTFCFR